MDVRHSAASPERGSQSNQRNSTDTVAPKSRLYLGLFLLVTVGVGVLIWRDVHGAYQGTLSYWDMRLTNSAIERAGYAGLWISERREDTETIATLSRPLLAVKTKQAERDVLRQKVERVMTGMSRLKGLQAALVGDAACRVVAGSAFPEEAKEEFSEACQAAQQTGKARIFVTENQAGRAWLILACPVLAEEPAASDQSPPAILGAAVIVAEPWKNLFHFLITESASAGATETLVVWTDKDEVVILEPHLAAKGVHSIFRQPLQGAGLEPRAARDHTLNFGEFLDYRGVPVLGVARSIGLADASLVRAVDKREALAPFHHRAALECLAATLSTLLFGGLLVAQRQHSATQALLEKIRQQEAMLALKRNMEVSEERFHELVQSVDVVVWEMEPSSRRLTFISQGAERIFREPTARWLEVPETSALFKRYVHPEDRGRTLACLEQTLADGGARSVEHRLTLAKNQTRWVRNIMRLGDAADGRSRLLRGVMVDITESKQAEAEVADRLRFETLLSDLTARFVNVPAEKLDEEIEAAQRQVCECLNLDLARVWQQTSDGSLTLTHRYGPLPVSGLPLGTNIQEYFPWTCEQLLTRQQSYVAYSTPEELPEEAARDRETLRRLGVKSGLTIAVRAGAGLVSCGLSFNTLHEARAWPPEIISRLQLVAQLFGNALERQRAEAARREQESLLRLFVRHAPAAIAMLDNDMRYLVVSRRWMKDFRLAEDDLLGRSHYEVFPDLPERWKAVHRRCLEGTVERCEEDFFPRQDGRTDWLRWEIHPWRRVDGAVGGIIIFSEVITERKEAREELQRSLEQVRALAARLQDVREKESKRLARELHDQLGQFLTAIKLDVKSLLAEIPGTPKGLSLLRLVEQTIRSVRRISAELRPGMLDDLGLVATIEWAGEDFQARTGIRCLLNLPQEEVAIDVERATAIYRILQETLTNVVRHARASEVNIRLATAGEDLLLEVRDNGKGFDRLRRSRRESLGILGMQERALMFGGDFRLDSSPGKGTTVTVRIASIPRG